VLVQAMPAKDQAQVAESLLRDGDTTVAWGDLVQGLPAVGATIPAPYVTLWQIAGTYASSEQLEGLITSRQRCVGLLMSGLTAAIHRPRLHDRLLAELAGPWTADQCFERDHALTCLMRDTVTDPNFGDDDTALAFDQRLGQGAFAHVTRADLWGIFSQSAMRRMAQDVRQAWDRHMARTADALDADPIAARWRDQGIKAAGGLTAFPQEQARRRALEAGHAQPAARSRARHRS